MGETGDGEKVYPYRDAHRVMCGTVTPLCCTPETHVTLWGLYWKLKFYKIFQKLRIRFS